MKNYSNAIKCEPDSKKELYDFVLKDVFKQLYGVAGDRKKPQVFIFFNAVDDIYEFDKLFESYASDFTNTEL